MSDVPSPGQAVSFHSAIDAFLQERLDAKLDKLKPDDPLRPDLIAQHQRGPWLESAAKRVLHIQAVTHALKPVHPRARGTNFYIEPQTLPVLSEVGSHTLGRDFAMDVVGDAAALDVYKLLRIEVNGRSLLKALKAGESNAWKALSEDPMQAQALGEAFLGLIAERGGEASTHVLAKQLYWLVGEDATDDTQYHLIIPLHATSLSQSIYEELQDARFGEANKQARQARRDGLSHESIYREYRDLAVQKMGGTKPHNVSQLNSERRGDNYLLASLPPRWKGERNYLPVHAASIFDRSFNARSLVRDVVQVLSAFLLSDPPKNQATRQRVESLVDALLDEMVIYAGELLHQPAGWTRDERFQQLARPEMLWLDPFRCELEDEHQFASDWLGTDWPTQVGARFGHWLNSQLKGRLPTVGVAESRQWRNVLLDEDGSWVQQLRALRNQLHVPEYRALQEAGDVLTTVRGGV
jgi:CRISPR-associated protein Csy1